MILKIIHTFPPLRKLYFRNVADSWVKEKISRFTHLLTKNDKILDIGSGSCLVPWALMQAGYQVTALDVADLSYLDEIKPVVYDGKRMPFDDHSFDVALLLTVLHHTPDPEAVFREAARVARSIILIEDVYSNAFQKYITFATDTLVNLGYSEMHYTNKSSRHWKQFFQGEGMHLEFSEEKKVLSFFRQATYFVKADD